MARIYPVANVAEVNDTPRPFEEFDSEGDLEFTVQLFFEWGRPIHPSWADLLDELDVIHDAVVPWRQRLGVESITIEEAP